MTIEANLVEELAILNPDEWVVYISEGIYGEGFICSINAEKLSLPEGFYFDADTSTISNGTTDMHEIDSDYFLCNLIEQ